MSRRRSTGGGTSSLWAHVSINAPRRRACRRASRYPTRRERSGRVSTTGPFFCGDPLPPRQHVRRPTAGRDRLEEGHVVGRRHGGDRSAATRCRSATPDRRIAISSTSARWCECRARPSRGVGCSHARGPRDRTHSCSARCSAARSSTDALAVTASGSRSPRPTGLRPDAASAASRSRSERRGIWPPARTRRHRA